MFFLWLDIHDAFKSFIRRPLRSFLSSIGIGIGVTALITMLSISEGAKQKALSKIRSLGTDTLRIEAAHGKMGAVGSRMNLSQGLLLVDSRRIGGWLGSRGIVGVYIKKEAVLVRVGNITTTATVMGVNANWFKAEKVENGEGRLFGENDVLHGSNFCVFGSELARTLQISPENTIRSVQIGSTASTLIGSLKPKGRLLTEGTGLSSLDFDNTVFLPITSMPYLRMIADRLVIDGMVISLSEKRGVDVIRIADRIEEILLDEHRAVEDFTMVAPITLLEEIRDSQRLFSIIMGMIAGLSLVVGGIGVMNVMLANITEQTREIGLRMAVGAPRSRIIRLYLWNSVVLTLIGSLWGVAVGTGLALTVQRLAGWEIVFSAFSMVVAPLSAILTGVIFGLHPALRAASLDPAEALRDT